MILHHGEGLAWLATLPAQSVDAILTDLPYGTTACSWDTIIPFAPMWSAVKRVLKPRGVFVTTASQPFTSLLVCSNLAWFRYEWIWEKQRATGFLDCDTKPLKEHENILIFGSTQATFNPQMTPGKNHSRGGARTCHAATWGKFSDRRTTQNSEYYPRSILKIDAVQNPDHPTQKPVSLYDYLTRTYTNPGDVVCDFCMGSGTTGVAALRLERDFWGCEQDAGYFAIAEKRLKEVLLQPRLIAAAEVERPKQDTLL